MKAKTYLLLFLSFCLFTLNSKIFSQPNWFEQPSPVSVDFVSVSFLYGNTGFACGGIKIIKGTNGEDAWTENYFIGRGASGTSLLRTINPVPPAPTLTSPLNNSTGISLTPTLDWEDLTDILNYRVQVSTDSNFSTTVIDDSSLVISQYTVLPSVFDYFTVYYWRVSAKDTEGWGSYSVVWNFRTFGLPLGVVLASPLNNSTNQPTDITFTWYKALETLQKVSHENRNNKVNNVTSKTIDWKSSSLDVNGNDAISNYWFELVTDTVSMAGLIQDTTLTDTTKFVSGLTFSTVYYWHVKAKNEQGWGPFSDWWKFTTTNGAPTLISPPYNATEIPVTPLLDWSDVTGAVKYRVQVSAYSNFSTLWIDDSSSTTSQFQVSPGYLAYNSLYYWRVKTKNSAGWGSYQTPFRFFTQVTPPPSPPVLVSPPNGATGQSLTPTLDWSDVSGAAKYRVQVSLLSNFSTMVIDDSSMTVSEYTVTPGLLSMSTVYYWRAAVRTGGGWSSFSSAWNFRTIGSPNQVILYSPPNNSTEQPTSLTFLWYKATETLEPFNEAGFTDKISDGVSAKNNVSTVNQKRFGNDAINAYWFELVTDTVTLAGLIQDTTLADTTKALSGLSTITSYFWRVKAQNSYGWGPFSVWWKFTTLGGLPTAPILLDPPNNATEIVVNPLLNWSDVTGATKYHLQVSAYSNFSVLWINDSSATISEFQVSPGILAYNSLYYWRVRAKNSVGWGSYQSPFRFFTQVVPPPALPTLLSPPNGSTGVTVTPTLDWSDPSGATKYRLQVSTLSNFSTTVIDDSSLTISQYTVSPGVLNPATTYYWRVKVKGSASWSSFTSAWNFRTLGSTQVTLYSPANNSTEQPTSLTFIWYKGVDALMIQQSIRFKSSFNKVFYEKDSPDAITDYWFELVTDTVTMAGLIQDTTLTDTLKSVTGLSINTSYYWHVRAKNELGWGSFSAWWKFTTVAGVPSPPALLSPPYNATEVVVNPLLDWSDVTGATNYHLQVSAYSNFSVLWINDSSSTVSQFQVPSGILAYNSLYYWRVRAKNFLGWGSYQTPFRFFTQVAPPPPVPILLSPADGETGVSLTPTLDWTDVSGAVKYRVQVSTQSNFGTTVLDDSSSAVSQFNVPPGILTYYTVYYWRVSAKNSTSWSSFTAARNFRTYGLPVAPVLYSPANNSTENPVDITFLWYKAAQTLVNSPMLQKVPEKFNYKVISNSKGEPDAISNYWFELVTDTVSMSGLVQDSILSDTTKSVTGLSMNTSYWWRVKAKNEMGWGAFSLWWKFTTVTGQPPQPPTLLTPPYNATEIPVTPLLDWSDVPGAVKYRVQVSAFSNFSSLWIDDSSSTVSQFQVSPGILAYNSLYYWRVKAKNQFGWGNYQTPFRFFTQISKPPSPPTLLSPANGATNVVLTPALDWSDVSGAVKYRVQLSLVSNFSTTLADDSTLTLSQYSVPPGLLAYNTLYYWRAAAKNATSWSSFSDAWSFTTMSPISPPVLLYPANGDTGIVVTPLMDWSDVTNATKYRLQISAFSSFAVLWVDKYVLAPESGYQVQPGVLAYNSRYFWRVKSFTDTDSSAYSATYYFFTKIHASAESEISSEIEESKTLDLNWLNSDRIESITIEISTDTLFTELAMKIDNQKLVKEVTIPTSTLDNYSTYFWRVKVTESNDRIYYSPIMVFVTGMVKRITSEKIQTELPTKFALYQNYPNPFNPVTKIKFDIPVVNGRDRLLTAQLVIYDILGREITTLVNMQLLPGSYEVEWNAGNYPSGVYYYRLITDTYTETRKMVLIR
jgi:hypothetical protein